MKGYCGGGGSKGGGGVPISKTFDGLTGMDFVDSGSTATSPHTRDTSSRYPTTVFIGNKKKAGKTAGKVVVNSILTRWVSFSARLILR